MAAYIEIEAHVTWLTYDLSPSDLQAIGEFTRENIVKWLNEHNWDKKKFFDLGVYGWVNFHAVCDDIDIPRATSRSGNWKKAGASGATI
jgi:hypothetical protein